jgi:DNA-binding GntR family transcriptional regulator
MSRTPVREALIRLATENLVTLLPNRGARVAEQSLNSTRQFFEALSLVQRAITRWAALRSNGGLLDRAESHMTAFENAAAAYDPEQMASSNREFHLAIAECAQNTYVAKLYRELLDEGMRLTHIAVVYDPQGETSRADHLNEIIRDHRAILAAIRSGDANAAERLGKSHSDLFRARVIDYIRGQASAEMSIE